MRLKSTELNQKKSEIHTVKKTGFTAKVSDYIALTKFRLAALVVFSAATGYFMAMDFFNWKEFVFLILGGFLVTGSSNGFNQVIERDLDKLMNRTKNRPIPAGRLGVKEALFVSSVFGIVGLILLWMINPSSCILGFLALFSYVAIYTPLKTKTPLVVLIGAFPGSVPPLLGYVAASNTFGLEAGILFLVQFFWQFPHFWAIGWFLHDDYQKAGFNMLPTGKRDKATAVQTILYTVWTILVSIIPVFGFTGDLQLTVVGAIVVFLLGLVMLYYAVQLFKKMTAVAARQLMLASVLYITLVQIIYVLDKFIR